VEISLEQGAVELRFMQIVRVENRLIDIERRVFFLIIPQLVVKVHFQLKILYNKY
jgi:hypothetical protein